MPAAPPRSPFALLGAALDTFYENGFHGTTVRDVVRRVGRTVPSLYAVHPCSVRVGGTGQEIEKCSAEG
ncbi:TetR family transcriptional regulator [Nocardia vinacea]|uniref:TetR family transcriptional regulator n=1 Tax=Nocardia vinacea TaxID=96468 RepID=UPI001FE154C3|nr:TetR family transcriptional regulator [Nocardia vinacea]